MKKQNKPTKRKTKFESAEKLVGAWLDQANCSSHGESATFNYDGRDLLSNGKRFARLGHFKNGQRVILKFPMGWQCGGNARHRALDAMRHRAYIVELEERDITRLERSGWSQAEVDAVIFDQVLSSQDLALSSIFEEFETAMHMHVTCMASDPDGYLLSDHNVMAQKLGLVDLRLDPPPGFMRFATDYAVMCEVARGQIKSRCQPQLWTNPRRR